MHQTGWQKIQRKEKVAKKGYGFIKNKEFSGYLSKNGRSIDLLKIEDLQENRDGGSDIILNFMWFQKLC